MGSQREELRAEQLYELAMETEIEEISESAEPSYHKNYSAPFALAILQKIIAEDGHITIEDIDYQVTKIELKPLRIHKEHGAGHTHHDNGHELANAEYETQMQRVQERQTRRKFFSREFNEQVVEGQYHDAFHTYVAETTENSYRPVTITPKQTEGEVPHLLEIDGVDYVLKEYLTAERYAKIESRINVPAKASVDQWPEEVILYDPKGKPKTYVRGDVIFYEAGKRVDLRFVPVVDPTPITGKKTTGKKAAGKKAAGKEKGVREKTRRKKS